MAGARVKPKCDIVGGKRLPDLKSLQAGKSKRRKLQEKKKVLAIKRCYIWRQPTAKQQWVCTLAGGLGKKSRLQEV